MDTQPQSSSRHFRPPKGEVPSSPFSTKLSGVPFSVVRGSQIYCEKDPAEYIYKVVSGVVRTYTVLIDGRRQIASFYLPGDVFGIDAEEEYASSAEAVTATKLLAIKRSRALSLADDDKEIARELWALRGQELHRAQAHILLLVKRAPERVASFLLEMAERIQADGAVELPMSRQDIADYLGLTIETVSRMLTLLEKISAIELPSSKCVVLRNYETLRRLNG